MKKKERKLIVNWILNLFVWLLNLDILQSRLLCDWMRTTSTVFFSFSRLELLNDFLFSFQLHLSPLGFFFLLLSFSCIFDLHICEIHPMLEVASECLCYLLRPEQKRIFLWTHFFFFSKTKKTPKNKQLWLCKLLRVLYNLIIYPLFLFLYFIAILSFAFLNHLSDVSNFWDLFNNLAVWLSDSFSDITLNFIGSVVSSRRLTFVNNHVSHLYNYWNNAFFFILLKIFHITWRIKESLLNPSFYEADTCF